MRLRALGAALVLLSCSRARPLDAQLRRCVPAVNAPQGIAEVGFALDTGGDQAHFPAVQSGLLVFVREGGVEQRRTFASCDSASVHSMDGMASLVEAFCDGRDYELTRAAGKVIVRQKGQELFSIPLSASEVRLGSSDVLPCQPAR